MNINKNKIFLLMLLSFVFNITKTGEITIDKNNIDTTKKTENIKNKEDLIKELKTINEKLMILKEKFNKEEDEKIKEILKTDIKTEINKIREKQKEIDNIDYKNSYLPINLFRSIQNTTEDNPKSTIAILTLITAGIAYLGYKTFTFDNAEENDDLYEDEDEDEDEDEENLQE